MTNDTTTPAIENIFPDSGLNDTVLVKFGLGVNDAISGSPLRLRVLDDQKNAISVGRALMDMISAQPHVKVQQLTPADIRKDTGIQTMFVQNAAMELHQVIPDLEAIGFKLVGWHGKLKSDPNRPQVVTKIIVVLTFKHESAFEDGDVAKDWANVPNAIMDLMQLFGHFEREEGVKVLAATAVFGWDNVPAGNAMTTLNFDGLTWMVDHRVVVRVSKSGLGLEADYEIEQGESFDKLVRTDGVVGMKVPEHANDPALTDLQDYRKVSVATARAKRQAEKRAAKAAEAAEDGNAAPAGT
jgi:hypothetical protein